MIKVTSNPTNSRDRSIVTFFRHDFRSCVDVEQLHFPGVSAEEEPLLTLREGRRGESSVRFRVSVCSHGSEFRVNEFPVETTAIESAVLRKRGAVQNARGDRSWSRSFVTRFRTPMRVEKRERRTNDDRIWTDRVLFAQVVRHDRVQRHLGRLRQERTRLEFAQDRRGKISTASVGLLANEDWGLGSRGRMAGGERGGGMGDAAYAITGSTAKSFMAYEDGSLIGGGGVAGRQRRAGR